MEILLIEPYHTGSHAAWASGFAAHTRHSVTVLDLPGRFWKWRMHGGAVTLARRFLAEGYAPDLILATDMLDLTTFLALTRSHSSRIPAVLYFHENQLSYPWSPGDRDIRNGRDLHYGFINYASAMAANAIFFNSGFQMESFLEELPRLLKHFPDYNELETVEMLETKAKVLPLGIDLCRFDAFNPGRLTQDPTMLVWNHRWEYDKNPDEFFRALYVLEERGLDFEVIILGESFRQRPSEFIKARERLGHRIRKMGYATDFADYARWLWRADILPVTSHHDFFGTSIIEATYCKCFPLLPRRLSYPELIPTALHDLCFYRDFDDLVDRLAHAVKNPHRDYHLALRQAVTRFDWREMAPVYDHELEQLCRIPTEEYQIR